MNKHTVISSLAMAFAASLMLTAGASAAETEAVTPQAVQTATSYGIDGSPIVIKPEAGCEMLTYNENDPAVPYAAELAVAIPEIAEAVNVRVTYSTSETAAHELVLSSGKESITLVRDTSVSRGSSVTTETVDVPESLAKKIVKTGKLSVSFSATVPDALIRLESLVFSFSEEQAYSYFGDSRKTSSGGVAITFGPGGNAGFHGTGSDGQFGQHMYFDVMDSLMINRCQKPYRGAYYMTMAKFVDKSDYSPRYEYVQIVYRAVTTSENVDIKLWNNKSGEVVSLGKVKKTEGFTVTEPVKLPAGHIARYADGIHCTLTFDDPAEHSNYFVKGIYFFKSPEDAALFTHEDEKQVPITVMGRSIADYTIVIPQDASYLLRQTSKSLQTAIKEKSGCELKIVYDTAPTSDAEIVLGGGIRRETEAVDLRYIKAEAKDGRIFFDAYCDKDIDRLVTRFSELYFEVGKASDQGIVIDSGESLIMGSSVDYTGYSYPAASEPMRVEYSFNTPEDMKYWNDPDGTWTHAGKVYKCAPSLLRVAESKLYDSDIELDLTFALSAISDNSAFGVMLRRNGDDAYVKVEYSPSTNMLTAYVKSSYVCREVPVAETGLLLGGKLEHSMKVSLIGTRLTVTVGNSTVLECDGIFYTAPGKAALFSKGLSVSVGKCDAVLYSTIGRVLGDAVFNEEILMQKGGDSNYRIPSLIATNSGTLIAAANDRRYTVADNAKEQWLVIRRKPLGGEWEELRVLAADKDVSYAIGTFVYDDVNDVIFLIFGGRVAVSRDDGVTWEIRKNTVAKNSLGRGGGTHGASAGFTLKYGEHKGRLITAARFSIPGTGSSSELLKTNHYNCSLYSDDGGLTWQTGGPVQVGTGEGTLIERADGTLVYNSRAYFNDHLRRVAYSYDGGATFEDFEDSWELLEVTHGVNASMLRAEIGCGQVITLFSNPYPTEDMMGTGNRRNMTVCLSLDEGRSFVTKKTAHAAFSAYSCLAYNRLTDTFFLFYESGPTNSSSYDNISVIEFNLEWLLENS